MSATKESEFVVHKCEFKLRGIAQIGFGKPVTTARAKNQKHDVFEEQTWRERMHVDSEGYLYIPANMAKNTIVEAPKFTSEVGPTGPRSTWTKHVESGLLFDDNLVLTNGDGKKIHKDRIQPLRLFVPSDGKRGGGKRVWKNFPVVQPPWFASGSVSVLDSYLAAEPDRIREFLKIAGYLIGFGIHRPRNNGTFGRFEVMSFDHLGEMEL